MTDQEKQNHFLCFKTRLYRLTVGFFEPEELIPSLLLGITKVYFDANQFDDALVHLNKLLTDYPKSSSAPEAIYLKGVCLYKSKNDPKPLKEAYEKLRADYPESEWALPRFRPSGLPYLWPLTLNSFRTSVLLLPN